MEKTTLASSSIPGGTAGEKLRTLNWHRAGIFYARIALGAAFLSAVASRFGFYAGRPGMDSFAGFMRYTAEVNSFMPSFAIPFLAWAATAAELFCGITLILGVWLRWTGLGAAALLALFGAAMATSFGIKSPLDYSVFSASAAAALLSLASARKSGAES